MVGGLKLRNVTIGYWWVLIVFQLAFYLAWVLLPKSETYSLLYVIPCAACWAAVVVLVRIMLAGRNRVLADWSHHLIFAIVAFALLIAGFYTAFFGYVFIWLVPVSVVIYILVTIWTAVVLGARKQTE